MLHAGEATWADAQFELDGGQANDDDDGDQDEDEEQLPQIDDRKFQKDEAMTPK